MNGRVIVVGSVNVDLVVTVAAPARPRRDRRRRPVRAAPRRQGRQPGRRRGPARRRDGVRRRGRRRRVRRRGAGWRCRPRGSTSEGWSARGARRPASPSSSSTPRARTASPSPAARTWRCGRTTCARRWRPSARERATWCSWATRSDRPRREALRIRACAPARRRSSIRRRPAASIPRRSPWPTSSRRTAGSWRASPATPGSGPAGPRRSLRDRLSLRAILVSLGGDGALLVEAEARRSCRPGPSRWSTRSAPATRSTARSPRVLPPGSPWPMRRDGPCGAAASLAVTRAGAREGMPTAAELQAAGG